MSASGEFNQNPNLTDRVGAMSFAQADAFEDANEERVAAPFQIPVREEPNHSGGAQQHPQRLSQRRGSAAEPQTVPSSQENDVKTKLLSQLS